MSAESALATAVKLAEVVAEEQRLGRIIATATEECRLRLGPDGYPDKTHLGAYLDAWNAELEEMRSREDEWWTPEPDEWSAMHDCPLCWPAYEAIQERKVVRRRRGALRAALVRIGKLALKEVTP